MNKLFLTRLGVHDIYPVTPVQITSQLSMGVGHILTQLGFKPATSWPATSERILPNDKEGEEKEFMRHWHVGQVPLLWMFKLEDGGANFSRSWGRLTLPGSLWVEAPGRVFLVPILFGYMVLCLLEDCSS